MNEELDDLELFVEWRLDGMDAPYFHRASCVYDEREFVERLKLTRGGRIQKRYLSEWKDDDEKD